MFYFSFLERNKILLHSIYDDLMFDVPECLENSTIDNDNENGIEEAEGSPSMNHNQFPSSIGEYHSDDMSSIGSYHR